MVHLYSRRVREGLTVSSNHQSSLYLCICVTSVFLYGCTSLSNTQVKSNEVSDYNNSYGDIFQRCGLMYLKMDPYKWIYLEVDVVEGTEIEDGVFDTLTRFLKTQCKKPVVVKLKEKIPLERAIGLPPSVLATQTIEGPPVNDERGPPAYIYMFFHSGYDGQAKWPAVTKHLYPCSVFTDMSHIKPSLRWLLPQVLMHECGHALGLWRRDIGENPVHCENKECLMYKRQLAQWSLGRFLVGKDPFKNKEPTVFCERCEQMLQEIKNLEGDCAMEFKGPFLVRKEKGYFVATLPSHLHLGLGATDVNWDGILELAHELGTEKLSDRPDGSYTTTLSQSYSDRNRRRVQGRIAIEAALNDPHPKVVELAQGLKLDWEKEFGHLLNK